MKPCLARYTRTGLLLVLLGALPGALQTSSAEGGPPARSARAELVIGSGETFFYDTLLGPLVVDRLVLEPGSVLRASGPRPFVLLAHGDVVVDGTIDVSGDDASDVTTLDTGNVPEPGAAGGPGGGSGGTASKRTNTSTAAGEDGRAGRPLLVPAVGGGGGESGYSPIPSANPESRRPGNGGGGALAASQPVHPDPLHPSNLGLVAGPGADGAPTAIGALGGASPPRGGAAGTPVFHDDDPENDFWGRKVAPAGGLIRGELAFPVAGSGGGAGGDALATTVFPPPTWSPSSDEKGAGGGGGGGLAILVARHIVVGPAGALRADGGDGARGENTFFLNHIGGSSGGGSGGMLVLQAQTLDLSAAGPRSLTALGGLGGQPLVATGGRGGNGGPGLIQLHVQVGGGVLLPASLPLDEVAVPSPHLLLAEPIALPEAGLAFPGR